LSTIRVKAVIQYSVSTAYDTTTTFTDSSSITGERKIIDAPILFTKKAGMWFHGSKTSQSYSSIKIADQSWATNDLQVETPPLITLYVVKDGVETQVYKGSAYLSKYNGDNIYEFILQDTREKFNQPLISRTLLGINPATEELLQMAVGKECFSTPTYLYDFATQKYSSNVYSFGDYPLATFQSLSVVYDSGKPLVATTDYTTGSWGSVSFPYSLTIGADMTGTPAGTVTCDTAQLTSSQWVFTAMVQQGLWQFYAPLVSGGSFPTPVVNNKALAWLTAKYNNPMTGLGFYLYDTKTAQRFLDDVADNINGFWFIDGAGLVTYDTLRTPETETPVHTFDKSNITSKVIKVEMDLAKDAKFKIGSQRNYRVLKDTEIVASVTGIARYKLTQPCREVSDFADVTALGIVDTLPTPSNDSELTTTTSTYYRKDKKDYFVSNWSDKTDGTRMLWHLCDLFFEKVRRWYSLDVAIQFSDIELGDVVKIDYDGISKNVVILEFSGDITENAIKVRAWG
jgi:hypothetical protein